MQLKFSLKEIKLSWKDQPRFRRLVPVRAHLPDFLKVGGTITKTHRKARTKHYLPIRSGPRLGRVTKCYIPTQFRTEYHLKVCGSGSRSPVAGDNGTTAWFATPAAALRRAACSRPGSSTARRTRSQTIEQALAMPAGAC